MDAVYLQAFRRPDEASSSSLVIRGRSIQMTVVIL